MLRGNALRGFNILPSPRLPPVRARRSLPVMMVARRLPVADPFRGWLCSGSVAVQNSTRFFVLGWQILSSLKSLECLPCYGACLIWDGTVLCCDMPYDIARYFLPVVDSVVSMPVVFDVVGAEEGERLGTATHRIRAPARSVATTAGSGTGAPCGAAVCEALDDAGRWVPSTPATPSLLHSARGEEGLTCGLGCVGRRCRRRPRPYRRHPSPVPAPTTNPCMRYRPSARSPTVADRGGVVRRSDCSSTCCRAWLWRCSPPRTCCATVPSWKWYTAHTPTPISTLRALSQGTVVFRW